LFFVGTDFAENGIGMNAMTKGRPAMFDWRIWVFWCGPALVAIGLVSEKMWRSFPAPRVVETLALALIAMLTGFVIRVLLSVRMATGIAIVFSVALAFFVGVVSLAATFFLAAAALSLGSAITGRRDLTAIVSGLSIIAGIIGWALPFPLHYGFVYFIALSAPIVWQWRDVLSAARSAGRAWGSAVEDSPRIAAFAVLALGLASAECWLPTVQYDDLAYHLGMPSQLAALHYYRMDVQSQFWALAPWSGDVLQSVVQLLAGKESRGALDAMWLAGIAGLSWQLSDSLGASKGVRWLVVALVASQPLTAALVGGMQAELPATAATLALAVIVANISSSLTWRDVLYFGLVAGFLIALKTGFIAIIAPLSVAFYWRSRGQWKALYPILALAVFLFVGASSYFYAAYITGNPMFPLLANVFPSTFASGSMLDTRWGASVNLMIAWQLTFHTADYLEGWNGAAGFSFLGLIGAVAIAITARRYRFVAVCAALSFVAAIFAVHYFRYTYPAIVLMAPASVAAAAMVVKERSLIIAIIALIVLNLGVQSCAFWTLHVGGVKYRLLASESKTIERFVPERTLIQSVRRDDKEANVLLCSPNAPFAAELAGRGFVASHYDPILESARLDADVDVSGNVWRRIFDQTNAGFAIVSTSAPPNMALAAALSDAHMIEEIGTAQLWKLARARGSDDLLRERDFASKLFR
jgi:hypothetical protein